ncbi:MAG: S41 family peptidase [Candidatus Paceibacterota bacterium]
MMNFLKEKKWLVGLVLILALAVFFSGIFIGGKYSSSIERFVPLSNISADQKLGVNFASFWKVWNAIDEKYPNATETNDEERVYGAIKGLVGSLQDPYSNFFDPYETELFEADIAGNFSGVGMEIGLKDGILTVIAPLKETPAYKAGIKSGDKILKINDAVTTDMTVDEAIKRIRGERGTTVTLTIFHETDVEPKEIKIVRDIINVPTLDTELRKDGIFVISLYSFSANSAELFRNAIKEFTESNTDKMLLDLRGNPGGYLEAAVDMASWFLDNGKTVVIEDYGTAREQKKYRSNGYDIFNENLKFVILVDGGSASASEILAGAMQDYKKAKLVGTKTYGKGSVQEVVEITKDTILKVTVANWNTPNNNSINNKGLTPDYEVKVTPKDIEAKKDPQLDKAVQLLLDWKQ